MVGHTDQGMSTKFCSRSPKLRRMPLGSEGAKDLDFEHEPCGGTFCTHFPALQQEDGEKQVAGQGQ